MTPQLAEPVRPVRDYIFPPALSEYAPAVQVHSDSRRRSDAELRILLQNPRFHVDSEGFRELPHFFGFGLRDGIEPSRSRCDPLVGAVGHMLKASFVELIFFTVGFCKQVLPSALMFFERQGRH